MTRFTQAIVRHPGRSAVSGLRAGGGPDPSFDGLAAEHAAYVAALEAAGLRITALDPLDAFPDALFVEDPALVFPEAAVLLRPGAPSREGEVALLRPALAAAFPQVIDLPNGYADGGDVMALPGDVLIGLSARTDRQGAEALVDVLAALGRMARVVETPAAVLHLKTASSIIDDETVLATAELAATGIFARYRVLTVPAGEERGANVLRANDTILVGNRFPRLAEMLDGHGATVQLLETSEIEKIDAGFTCMSLRW